MGKFGKYDIPKFLVNTQTREVDEDTDLQSEQPTHTQPSSHKISSFSEFAQESDSINEEDMIIDSDLENEPCEDCDNSDTLSEKAKETIKNMCNSVLIHEAHLYESSEDPNQTYETFLREATHYMAECLIRAAQNLKV